MSLLARSFPRLTKGVRSFSGGHGHEKHYMFDFKKKALNKGAAFFWSFGVVGIIPISATVYIATHSQHQAGKKFLWF